MNKRQQRRRIRDSKTQDEGSLRTRRRSSEAYVPPAQEPAVVEATAEAQVMMIFFSPVKAGACFVLSCSSAFAVAGLSQQPELLPGLFPGLSFNGL